MAQNHRTKSMTVNTIEKYESPQEQRAPIADEVRQFAIDTANRAEKLSIQLNEKLKSVMNTGDTSCPDDGVLEMDIYPPLFNELRESLQTINSALNSISTAISCTEL